MTVAALPAGENPDAGGRGVWLLVFVGAVPALAPVARPLATALGVHRFTLMAIGVGPAGIGLSRIVRRRL